jgi:hypothetical protein
MSPSTGMDVAQARTGTPSSPAAGVDAGHERRSEQERPVADRDHRPARGDQRSRIGSSWPVRSRRRVTTARRLATPMRMMAASSIRAVTKPSATASFCRLTTENSATAVPMQARH